MRRRRGRGITAGRECGGKRKDVGAGPSGFRDVKPTQQEKGGGESGRCNGEGRGDGKETGPSYVKTEQHGGKVDSVWVWLGRVGICKA